MFYDFCQKAGITLLVTGAALVALLALIFAGGIISEIGPGIQIGFDAVWEVIRSIFAGTRWVLEIPIAGVLGLFFDPETVRHNSPVFSALANAILILGLSVAGVYLVRCVFEDLL